VAERRERPDGECRALPEGDLAAGARELSVALDDDACRMLALYEEELLLWNRRLNLTAIEDPAQVRVKHFLDSLSGALVVDLAAAASLVDVGTGAGFPGLVLKIAFPHLRLLLLDAVQKRLRFLERLCQRLGIRDVAFRHARAEEAGRDPAFRERFDVVTARAVAPLNVLCEYCLPLARVGGVFLAYKGPEIDEEIARAAVAIRLLGGGAPSVRQFALPQSDVRRSLVTTPKIAPTPAAYPRRTGSARKHPL
jgi:16S rRNA (guanine527-N7)-methyltransferase